MKSQPDARRRRRIEDLRIPAVKGISDDIYHMLHRSFVSIAKMHRSIEVIDFVMDRSMQAIHESRELLERQIKAKDRTLQLDPSGS